MKNPLQKTSTTTLARALRLGMIGLLAVAALGSATPASAATVVVDTTTDQALGDCSSSCSLRDAVATANPGDTVQIPTGHYVLTLGHIEITKDLAIVGSGARATVIDGNANSRAFLVSGVIEVAISDLSMVNGRNTLTGSNGGGGGAILASGPDASNPVTLGLYRCTISGNEVPGSQGGGVYLRNAVMDLEGNTFSDNTAAFSGGGLSLSSATGSVVNSTFSGNSGSAGAGIGFAGSTVSFVNNTVTGNQGSFFVLGGAGILGNLSTAMLTNNIVSDNQSLGQPADCNFLNGTYTTDHNLDSDGTCGFAGPGDLSAVDPLLGPLADNGGPTDTHALAAASPARDGGSNAACPATDQRGVARPGGALCDIGAFELILDSDGDGVNDDIDNCPANANPGQADNDLDGTGDVCDNDDDNDGVLDVSDNCPLTANVDQEDNDLDGAGDVCDSDDDNDGVADGADNCPFSANADQSDVDSDGLGDVCDDDPDGDGVLAGDNCPLTPNPGQADNDFDGDGDACDLDDDNDGVDDDVDNCPLDDNVDQADLDGDNIGDVCDADIDGDGVTNDIDNCPVVANPGQDDADGDLDGDACDADDDNDGIDDDVDNCPYMVNPDQIDTDSDGEGDVCDGDLDGDGVDNEIDNCPLTANGDQFDFDGDGAGDACDADIDGDGVANGTDVCAFTAFDEVVEPATGCSIDQLCPCDGPRGTTQPWKNHGKYVSCVSKSSKGFVKQGLITNQERSDIVSAAAQSSCGK